MISIILLMVLAQLPTHAQNRCAFTQSLDDGCSGSQVHGTIINSHIADAQAVIALNIVGGSGYTDGTFKWTSGGGCSTGANGTITVVGGVISSSNYAISEEGAGCTSRPTIPIPAQAAGGHGGKITPTVYQLTPHNSEKTIGSTWSVPGVDYPVGYDTSMTLSDPTRDSLPACAALSGQTVTIHSSNCTLDGWNFALHSSNLVIDGGLNNIVISNNLFACIKGRTTELEAILVKPGSTNTTIKYNIFDGGSASGAGCIPGGQVASVNVSATGGSFVFEYNYCHDTDSKCLNFQSAGESTLTIVEKFNYYAEIGMCGSRCSHGEAEYSYGAVTQTLSWTSQFNVAINHFYGGPTDLTSEFAYVGDSIIHLNDKIEYNYALAQGTQSYRGSSNKNAQVASASFFCGHQEGGNNKGGIWRNNLIDYSGAFFPYNQSGSTCAGDFPHLADFNAGTGNPCNTSTCN